MKSFEQAAIEWEKGLTEDPGTFYFFIAIGNLGYEKPVTSSFQFLDDQGARIRLQVDSVDIYTGGPAYSGFTFSRGDILEFIYTSDPDIHRFNFIGVKTSSMIDTLKGKIEVEGIGSSTIQVSRTLGFPKTKGTLTVDTTEWKSTPMVEVED